MWDDTKPPLPLDSACRDILSLLFMALEAKKQTCHPDSGAQSISVPLTSEDTQLSVLKSILIELKLIREDTNKLCATQQSLKTEVEILRSEFKNVEDVLHSFSGSGVTEVDLTAVNDRGVNLTLAPPLGDGTEVVTTLGMFSHIFTRHI